MTTNQMNGSSGTPSVVPFYFPPEDRQNAELELMRKFEAEEGRKFANYEDWYEFTCREYPRFWKAVLEFCKIKTYSPYSEVVEMNVPFEKVPRWFVGATTNYADNCLSSRSADKVAFIQASQNRQYEKFTYAQLYADVSSVAAKLQRLFGVQPGDHICGYLPNIYETIVAMLATAALGAVWSSTSTDFGPTGVLDRFKQVKPKVLFVVDRVCYKLKVHSLIGNVTEVVAGLPDLTAVVMIPQHGSANNSEINVPSNVKFARWLELTSEPQTEIQFHRCSFDHPLFVLFSSGTTGVPKCLVHSVGGTLLKHCAEHVFQTNMTSDDVLLFYTTCGWMMWNWMATVLFCGSTIVLYDESPLEPDPHILLKVTADTKTTILGMGAKIYDEYAKTETDFKSLYDLSPLRLVLSTASPLKAATFEFINSHIRHQVVIGSISGGTDIVGCFMGATLNRPVVAGECQHFYLGVDMSAFDETGKPVRDARGELVCRRPFPSMPVRFLNDGDGARYRAAYFNGFRDVWTHGDFVLHNSQTNGIVVYGRSDTTLNRGGVRIGTAEIYAIVERFEEIADSVVVGQKDPNDEDNELVLLFVKMRNGFQLNDTLIANIRTTLRERMSPRHVPNAVLPIDDIPYTNSGKKVELAVKQILNGEVVKNVNSLRNPESLRLFERFRG